VHRQQHLVTKAMKRFLGLSGMLRTLDHDQEEGGGGGGGKKETNLTLNKEEEENA
jgi:hypothetical protein